MQRRIISVCSVTISLCIICLMAWKIYTWEIQSDIESGNIGVHIIRYCPDDKQVYDITPENMGQWDLLTQGLLDAETNAFPHMTFDDLFGDMDIETLQNDESGLILTDEMYLFEREFDPEARTGGGKDSYISLIFLVESCNGARVNINHYLATIDLTTGQYIHFNDLMNMDELSRLLRDNLFDVYEGTYAEFKEEDAHESEVIEEFIETIEKRLNSLDTTQWLYGDVMEHTAANPHYGLNNGQNVALDDKYLYIRFYDSEYYALNDHFILRIPLEYTNIEVPGSELEEPVTVIAKETHYYAGGSRANGFIKCAPIWNNCFKGYNGVTFYNSKSDAKSC